MALEPQPTPPHQLSVMAAPLPTSSQERTTVFPQEGQVISISYCSQKCVAKDKFSADECGQEAGDSLLTPRLYSQGEGSTSGQQAKNTGTLIALTPTPRRVQVLQEAKEPEGGYILSPGYIEI